MQLEIERQLDSGGGGVNMDQLQPLHNSPQVFITKEQQCGNITRKKPVMSILDMLISVWVISPLVVAQWVGTWGLMDVYARFFPPWETFIFGALFHLCFAMLRENLHQWALSEKKKRALHFLRRVYTYWFNVLAIMNWRGGWILFDGWLGIETLQDGRTAPGDNISIALIITGGCLLALAFLRSVKNISGPPFVICLDTKQEDFHFPTRFRIQVSYTTLYMLHSEPKINEELLSLPTPITPERLTANTVGKTPPRPFLNDLRGTPPEAFSSTTITPFLRNYPQIQHYRNPLYPKSIQDIIKYISENPEKHKEIANNSGFLSNFNDIRYRRPVRKKEIFYHEDPFYRYKPEDPGDVNLLASSNFRFAPAVLANTHYKPKPIQPMISANNLDVIRSGIPKIKKPLSVTLTIFPTANEPFQGMKYPPRYASGPLPRKMVVHLNLYPEEGQGQGIGQYLPVGMEKRRVFIRN